MGDVGGFLFGSSEDAKQVGNAPLLTGNQNSLLSQLTNQLMGQMGQGVESYGGTYTPGASPTQGRAFNLIDSLMGGGQGVDQSRDFISQLLQPYDDQGAKDYYNDAIMAPTMQAWQNDVLPQVREAFISQGAGSSGAANRAIANSAGDMMTNLNANRASVLYGDKQQGVQNALQGAGMNQDLNSLLVSLGLSGGAQQRQIASEQGMETFNDWQTEQAYNNPWLQMMNLAMGTQAFQPIVQGPTQTGGAFSDIMSLLGGMDVGSMFQGMPSMGGFGGFGGSGGGSFAPGTVSPNPSTTTWDRGR